MADIWQDITIGIVIVFVSVGLSVISDYLITWVFRRFVSKTNTLLDDVVLETIHFPIRAFVVIFGFNMAISRVALPSPWGTYTASGFFLLYLILTYIFFYRLITNFTRWYEKEVVHKTTTELDDKFLDLFRRMALILLSLIVVVILLGGYGIEISSVVTTLGIGSLAVALAAQDTLSNLFAGFTLLLDQPFRVGDRIEILDINTWGDVQEIGLRSTRILTPDHRAVIIPNSLIIDGLIVNYSQPTTKYRVETTVGVAYGVELEAVRRAIMDGLNNTDWVLKEQAVEVLLTEFGDSSLNFRVLCWVETYRGKRLVMDKLNSVVYDSLNKANIEIPFPQRDVRLITPKQ